MNADSDLDTSYTDSLERLLALADPRIQEINERHGDDHAVNLTKLRAIAKELKKNHELALKLWDSGDTAAKLLSLLIAKPRQFSEDELSAMLKQARTPKVSDWLLNYIVKKHPAWNNLRVYWLADEDPKVQAAGWMLNTHAVITTPDALNFEEILDEIEKRMKDSPDRLQWMMNECLAQIGIHVPECRERAIAIGEDLEVLKEYPTPPNCTSPFAPIWIDEMVRRGQKK